MKIIYRIPQSEPYSYIEVEVELTGDQKPDSYEAVKGMFDAGEDV